MAKKKPAAPNEVPLEILKDLKNTVKGKNKEPRLSDISQHFFALAGGPAGVAKLLHLQVLDPKTPAFVRARIVDIIMRAMKYSEDKIPVVEDTGLLTEDELDREIDKQFESLMASAGVSLDAPGETDTRNPEDDAQPGGKPQAGAVAGDDPTPGAGQAQGATVPGPDQGTAAPPRGEGPADDRRPQPVPADAKPRVVSFLEGKREDH